MFIYTIKSGNRGVAQPGSASGLGPEGRRFKSCRPDHYCIGLSRHTLSELKLKFSSKDDAIKYAKKNKIDYEVIDPKSRKVIKKSYADNFTK